MGAGAVAFLRAELRSGIDVVLETIHFDEMLRGSLGSAGKAGKVDGQSVQGKVISGVAKGAPQKNRFGSCCDRSDRGRRRSIV